MKTNHPSTPTVQTPATSSPAIDQRSPLEFPFGCFVADTPGHGGAQTFLWFPSEVAVLAYLRTDVKDSAHGIDDTATEYVSVGAWYNFTDNFALFFRYKRGFGDVFNTEGVMPVACKETSNVIEMGVTIGLTL